MNNEKEINGIKCDAKNCVYHGSDNSCHAGKIEVGYCSSCSCSETACTTFKAKG